MTKTHSPKRNSADLNSRPPLPKGKKIPLSAIIMSLALPVVFGKSLIVYFGSKYSTEPGEGYGYGLVIMILFTVSSAGRFIWKYRDYGDT